MNEVRLRIERICSIHFLKRAYYVLTSESVIVFVRDRVVFSPLMMRDLASLVI